MGQVRLARALGDAISLGHLSFAGSTNSRSALACGADYPAAGYPGGA
jgi:hypothetical protein